MPVVQVFVPPRDDMTDLLDRVCRAVADALGLEPDGVIATHVPVAATHRPGRAMGHDGTVWPVVVVHSSPREADAVRRAVAALEELAATWSPTGDHWVTWQERR